MATTKTKEPKLIPNKSSISKDTLKTAFTHLATAKYLTTYYEENFKLVSKYVHATSRGHEAIQLACSMQLLPQDYAYPYYRDDSFLLGIGMKPYDLMLQLFAKRDDPFSGGRSYYAHPSLRDEDKPKIPHQSSATGMQAIPATGSAMGMKYKELKGIGKQYKKKPITVCSIGDASMTEGEVSEALQMAGLKQLPILFLVQDNEWDISASADEIRAQDASEFVKGFHGIEGRKVNGSDFIECYTVIEDVIKKMRKERRPFLVHAKVPLLNHHTSGVRMEWYRDDLEEDKLMDPYPIFRSQLRELGFKKKDLDTIEKKVVKQVQKEFQKARQAEEPRPEEIEDYIYASTPVIEEKGVRVPESGQEVVMVDAALHAIEEVMREDERTLLYGQDVGKRLGGVFREAATLAHKFGDDRVFNTPIQEAFIVGSTVGMSAVGLKPIVEVQFADYIFPGINQLFTEVSRSCYLSCGKYPVDMILRVPIGAYGSGGPYHSSSVESIICNIKGIKVAYPSNAADMKGLMKSAYHDPNPVVMFEHKGLYWSKVPGTNAARCIEPDADYVIPFGKGNCIMESTSDTSVSIITYGMGVHWALNAAQAYEGQVEIIDLRTLVPLDENIIFGSVEKNHRCIVLTEECLQNSFARNIAGLIQENCFQFLDAPVITVGSMDLPAIPIHSDMEATMLPSSEKLQAKIEYLLAY